MTAQTFDSNVLEMAPRLRAFLRRRVRDDATADDLTQDTLLKAMLAKVIPRDRRGTGYGVFDTLFGVAWFAGSAAMGLLYDQSVLAVVIFSVALQLAALPVFVLSSRAAT